MTCSLAAPLFIAFGDGKFLEKIFPSILSCLTAILTSWIQLRKPQKLWSLYRGAQRKIEDQMTKHKFAIDEYSSSHNPDSLLAKYVADIALNAHNKWTEFVPSPENISLGVKNKHEK